jgi:hypothetical protein
LSGLAFTNGLSKAREKSANAEGNYRVHELHYQMKARADGLHKNFECYNFAYRKDTKAPVISYRTKWPTRWTNEWFYMKVDEKKREKLMSMLMSPLKLSFGMTQRREKYKGGYRSYYNSC